MRMSFKRAIQIGNKLEVFLYSQEDTEWMETEIARKVKRGLNAGKTVTENGYKSFFTVDAIFNSPKSKNYEGKGWPTDGSTWHEGEGYIWAKDGERVKCEKTLVEIDPNGKRTKTLQGFVWKSYGNI
jgi:hypothetical protein